MRLDQRKLKSLNTRLKKQKTGLEKAVNKFMKLTFACEADAQEALKRFLKEQQNDFYPLSSKCLYYFTKKGPPGSEKRRRAPVKSATAH
ncbi:MAG: hypothetical protein AB1767_03385 [Bacillota bacterium]